MNDAIKFLSLILSFVLISQPVAFAGDNIGGPQYPIQLQRITVGKPVELKQSQPTIEELIQRTPYPSAFQQAIPLRGVNIAGLGAKTLDALGFNYFVAVDNTQYERMSDIYRDSRMGGKSNFVTADSIIHPYFAFTNRVLADVAIKQVRPDIALLMQSMQLAAIDDYKDATDDDVRKDIEGNLAFLTVALQLLNPRTEMPRIGDVPELVDAEMEKINAGRIARSEIFQQDEDYSRFKPVGFYTTSSDLQNFYRCRQWLSTMEFPLTDVSIGDEEHKSNAFRRAVLMFRCLNNADVLGKPAMDLWARLVRANQMFGTQVERWHERPLYPPDFKNVFNDRTDLKRLVRSLGEPLYRTRLLLEIRRAKPMNLSATSIFDLDMDANGPTTPVFKLFPRVDQAEMPWLREAASMFPADKEAAPTVPVALLDQYVWGSPAAGNLLCDILFTLDPKIAKILPDLQRFVTKRAPGGQVQPVDDRSWRLLATYFKPMSEPGVPKVLQNEIWGGRHVLSAAAAWVDSVAAIAPEMSGIVWPTPPPAGAPPKPATATDPKKSVSTRSVKPAEPSALVKAGTTGAAPNQIAEATGDGVHMPTAQSQAPPRRLKRVVPYHYLEPNTELYHRLIADANKLQSDIECCQYFYDPYKARFNDFIRLFERLEKISEQETHALPISVVDRRLLANIDQVLDKVDVPLPVVLPIEVAKKEDKFTGGSPRIPQGVNLAVGRPASLYIIYQNPVTSDWTLARGAVYTYYELPIPLLSQSMWKHRLDAGFVSPPNWSAKFEIVQKDAANARKPILNAAK